MPPFRNYPPSFDFWAYYSSKVDGLTPSDALNQTMAEIDHLLYEVVDKEGIPLIIKNLHHHPCWNKEMENNPIQLLSFQFLEDFYGSKGKICSVNVRNYLT